jgi:aminomethyltransferase
MTSADVTIDGVGMIVSRGGYTGEDGYEISVPDSAAEGVARWLLDQPEVAPIGLGARDSLRLEAGLCLYGHDIDETTTPIEGTLAWTIGKRRREEGGFPGAANIQRQLANGVSRRRVGILPEGRAPAREGTVIADADGTEIGHVTSGGFGPSVGGPVAMGYVAIGHAKAETPVSLMVRGKAMPAKVAKMPFVPAGYYRG